MINATNLLSYIVADVQHQQTAPYFNVKSAVFQEHHAIPDKYTCQGKNVSLPLRWYHVPRGTKSFALIMFDPDAPGGTWYHWGMYNLPKDLRVLPEAAMIPGARLALNNWGNARYQGPCPSAGIHRYVFRLFALNKKLNIKGVISVDQLQEIMRPSIIDSTELMGIAKAK